MVGHARWPPHYRIAPALFFAPEHNCAAESFHNAPYVRARAISGFVVAKNDLGMLAQFRHALHSSIMSRSFGQEIMTETLISLSSLGRGLILATGISGSNRNGGVPAGTPAVQ